MMIKVKQNIILRILTAVSCTLMVFCSSSENDDMAAGGTSLGNGAVVGLVVGPDNEPVNGVELRLRPEDFRADTSGIHTLDAICKNIIADADGSFKFDSVEAGRYVIEANHYDSLTGISRFVMPDPVESIDLDELKLKRVSVIRGVIDMSGDAQQYPIFVFLLGTEHFAKPDISGNFIITSAPADSAVTIDVLVFRPGSPLVRTFSLSTMEDTVIIADTIHVSESYFADSAAVRAILDSNSLTSVEVKEVVTISENRVVGLDLSNLGISHITSDIGVLTQLNQLTATSTSLSTLPSELALCSQLDKVNLSYNKLSTFPSVLWQISSITYLDLSHNDITEPIPDGIGNLTSLDTAFLSFNYIPSISNAINKCDSLLAISIDQNRLTGLPDSLVYCDKLEKLVVNNNMLASLPDSIGKLHNLKILSLQVNHLDSLPATFTDLVSLEELNIASNYLNDLSLTTQQMQNITKINVRFNSLCDISTEVKTWLDTANPGWDVNRVCP